MVPTYVARAGITPGVSRTPRQQTIGSSLSAAGTGVDMLGTTISGSYVLVQALAGTAGGPIGPDDAFVHLGYYAVDQFENTVSRIGAGLTIAADLYSGGSNVDFQSREVIIGQDSAVLGVTTVIGEFAGDIPVAGPLLDTVVNLAVNTYDVGRLSGDIPTVFELRGDTTGFYALFYPSPE
jgi:hypothetical protein